MRAKQPVLGVELRPPPHPLDLGAVTTEYALLAVLIALVIAGTLTALGFELRDLFSAAKEIFL